MADNNRTQAAKYPPIEPDEPLAEYLKRVEIGGAAPFHDKDHAANLVMAHAFDRLNSTLSGLLGVVVGLEDRVESLLLAESKRDTPSGD